MKKIIVVVLLAFGLFPLVQMVGFGSAMLALCSLFVAFPVLGIGILLSLV